jgi:RNA polymerase sigma-70 factor (sigma-E family)
MRREQRDREFEEFVTAAWPRLRRASFLLTHHTQDAEDLLQHVLIRAYAAWPRVRRDEAYAYVHRSLVNAYIDSTRRRPHPTPTGSLPHQQVPSGETVIDDRSELLDLLQPLTPRERAVVVLRHYLATPEREVAAALGIAPGTVKSTASRAIARLRATQHRTDQKGVTP